MLALEHFEVVVRPDLNAWLADADDPLVVLALDPDKLDLVVDLRERRPEVLLVVLLPDPDEQAQLGHFGRGPRRWRPGVWRRRCSWR
ncbi:MAG: hypothetical protein OEM84_14480 [Acidimicrobiia bacterium]|nr:hypothetical protein [Acidimicrobiia bacterium]